MEPFENEKIVPNGRSLARMVFPMLVQAKRVTDSLLADEEFLDFGGELNPEDQVKAAKMVRERFPMKDLLKMAKRESETVGERVMLHYETMQAVAVGKLGKAWTMYLGQRRYLDHNGDYSPGLNKVRPTLTDADRERARKAIDPLRGLGAMDLVLHHVKAFLEWVPSVMQFELRQHATIPQIRKRVGIVIDRRIQETISALATSIHQTVWEVINKTFSELQENIYFIAEEVE